MKVELVQHTGIRFDEALIEFDQWQVFATGSDNNRVLVGYLSHDESLPLMLICNQPMNVLRELIEKLEKITKRKVIPPVEIVYPPEIDNEAGEDEPEEDKDDDGDS
jgi:hypothetical protein